MLLLLSARNFLLVDAPVVVSLTFCHITPRAAMVDLSASHASPRRPSMPDGSLLPSAVLVMVLPMIVDHDPHWDRWEHVGRCHHRPCGCCLSQRGLIKTPWLKGYCHPCYEGWCLTTVCHAWFRTVRRFANHRWGRDSKQRYAWPARFVPSSIAEDKGGSTTMNSVSIDRLVG